MKKIVCAGLRIFAATLVAAISVSCINIENVLDGKIFTEVNVQSKPEFNLALGTSTIKMKQYIDIDSILAPLKGLTIEKDGVTTPIESYDYRPEGDAMQFLIRYPLVDTKFDVMSYMDFSGMKSDIPVTEFPIPELATAIDPFPLEFLRGTLTWIPSYLKTITVKVKVPPNSTFVLVSAEDAGETVWLYSMQDLSGTPYSVTVSNGSASAPLKAMPDETTLVDYTGSDTVNVWVGLYPTLADAVAESNVIVNANWSSVTFAGGNATVNWNDATVTEAD